MKGETPPMRVLLVVDSSTGFRGATNVIQKGGGSGFAAILAGQVLGSMAMHELKVQCDAGQALEHLVKGCQSIVHGWT